MSIFAALSWWICHFDHDEELLPSNRELIFAIARSVSLKLTVIDTQPTAIEDNYLTEEAYSAELTMRRVTAVPMKEI